MTLQANNPSLSYLLQVMQLDVSSEEQSSILSELDILNKVRTKPYDISRTAIIIVFKITFINMHGYDVNVEDTTHTCIRTT